MPRDATNITRGQARSSVTRNSLEGARPRNRGALGGIHGRQTDAHPYSQGAFRSASPRNSPHWLACAGVAFGTDEPPLQRCERRNHLRCLEGAIAPTDGDLPTSVRINKPPMVSAAGLKVRPINAAAPSTVRIGAPGRSRRSDPPASWHGCRQIALAAFPKERPLVPQRW